MSMRVFTFLNPVPVPPGRAYLLLPDRRSVQKVEEIPPWYWPVNERLVGLVLTGLPGNMILATYFLCYMDEEGNFFRTVVGDEQGEFYTTLGMSPTYDEALRMHEHWQRQLRARTTDQLG